MAKLADKVIAWLLSNDTGKSSKTLCAVLYRIPIDDGPHTHPIDSSDFGRCKRFLAILSPEKKRVALALVRGVSLEWDALAESWDYLENIPGHATLCEQIGRIIRKARREG